MSFQTQGVGTYTPVSQRLPHVNEDGHNDLDLDSNDDFDDNFDDDDHSLGDFDDDDDSAEYNMPVTESPRAQFAPGPPPPLCIVSVV